MKGFWELILRLYPTDYRTRFSEEMSQAFDNAVDESYAQRPFAFARLAVAELTGLVIGAGMEWFAKLTTDRSVRGRCLPDLRMMRPPGVRGKLWFAEARFEPGRPDAE
jgi:hypothetical protein